MSKCNFYYAYAKTLLIFTVQHPDVNVKLVTFYSKKLIWCIQPVHSGIVATSQLGLHWICDSPQMGCACRITPIHKWRKQAIIEWSCWVITIVACCHSVKLSALATWAFRLQQNGAVKAMSDATFTKRTCDHCSLLLKRNVVATSHLALHWMCDSPWTGSAKNNTYRQVA